MEKTIAQETKAIAETKIWNDTIDLEFLLPTLAHCATWTDFIKSLLDKIKLPRNFRLHVGLINIIKEFLIVVAGFYVAVFQEEVCKKYGIKKFRLRIDGMDFGLKATIALKLDPEIYKENELKIEMESFQPVDALKIKQRFTIGKEFTENTDYLGPLLKLSLKNLRK